MENLTIMRINILGMCEVRWTGAGLITSDEYTVIYSGGHTHERGVGILLDEQRSKCLIGYWTISDRIMLVKLKGKPFDISIIQVYAPTADKSEEEHEQFYNDLEMAKSQCKSQYIVIVMGDFNAKVGDEIYEDTVGPHGLGNRNERGEKLIEWAKSHGRIIGNTWFEQHPRRLWTWKSPGDNTRNQIDYMLINSRFRNALLVAKTFPGADCGSDHVPVCGTIRLKLKKIKSAIYMLNAIYMLRTLTERAIEIQRDLYLCFIDYTKAFDKLRHEEIMSILDSLNIDGKDLRIVRNIYWEQTAAMRIGNDLSAFQDIKRGVRQGCVLSPDLFPIYSEIIMRALEGMPGIKVGGYNMNNIRYADDTVLIADNENELQEMLDTVVRESEKKGLSLNKKKTEVMVISKKNCTPACNIVMNGTVLKQVHKFNYLGSLITSDGRCINEIKRRMAQAKASFQNMKSILTNTRLSLRVRKRVLQCYIEPILLYGCEAWSMTKQTSTSIEAMEMWFLRRMLRVSWTEKRTNLEILNTASSTRKLMNNIKRRQAEFLGHVIRKGKLEHLLTTGKIEGKRC